MYVHWPFIEYYLTASTRAKALPTMYMHPHSSLSCAYSLLAVEKMFPGDRDKLARLSLIEGHYSVV